MQSSVSIYDLAERKAWRPLLDRVMLRVLENLSITDDEAIAVYVLLQDYYVACESEVRQ